VKKFNLNSILFAFVMVFILVGLHGQCFVHLKGAAHDLLTAVRQGDARGVMDFRSAVDEISNEDLSYHSAMMDVDSLKNNLLGTRIVSKDGTTVVKADSGSLIDRVDPVSDEEIRKSVECLQALEAAAEENGAGFLYCAAPKKELYETAPPNAENAFPDNYDRLLQALDAAGIPTLDLSAALKESGVPDSEIFYYTDHHWTARSGFLAANAVCKRLSSLYGFPYNEEYADLGNYTVTTYPDWFLGSKGKTVGTYFTWRGADDFELITPNFETSLTEEQPFKDRTRQGAFEDTVLYLSNMKKDYYHISSYATYSGGDYRLQIMTNLLNPNGKKILLVRDSFACVVAPFLALQTGELHICDVRNNSSYVGEKLNLEEYIREIRPDCVIVLYSGVAGTGGGKFNFF